MVIAPVVVSLIPADVTVAVTGSYPYRSPNAADASALPSPSASVQWGTQLPGR